mmetsp:Transcript_17153/g.19296  ORF Transcript_17153/g.19296 Transcript_17153/m.19296 type:complete len:82 (+) Transcript_17153:584-829(+)
MISLPKRKPKSEKRTNGPRMLPKSFLTLLSFSFVALTHILFDLVVSIFATLLLLSETANENKKGEDYQQMSPLLRLMVLLL